MTWGIFKHDSVADAVVKVQKEGWDDMLKSVKDKNGPQPNGGSGKKQGTRYGGGKQKEDESDKRKEKNESIEQIDELSKTTLSNYIDAAKQDNKDHADSRRSGDEHEAKWAKDRMVKRSTGMGAAKQRLNKEDVTEADLDIMIAEVLKASDEAGKWIGDFVKSDNPKFAGKSSEKRKQMALAAYYAAQKKESTDYETFIELDEEVQKDIVKMGAKEIKHANVKDKQNDQEVMEPHSKGEQGFLDAHSVLVTDDPARGGSKTGADKLSHASEPKGKGPGSYDAKEKLGKQGVKEDTGSKEASIEEGCTSKASGKKTFLKFKAEKKGN